MEVDDEDDPDLRAALALSVDPTATSPAGLAAAKLKGGCSEERLAEADTIKVLNTLLSNLAKDPGEVKYRRVKLSNAKIAKALACPGAKELLFAAGFAEVEEALEIPADRSNDDVSKAVQDALTPLCTYFGSFMLAAQLRTQGAVRCVCATQDGGIATGAMDNLVRLYSEGLWDAPKVLVGHETRAGTSGVLALAADPADPSAIASAGRDGKIILWREGAARSTLTGHGEGCSGSNVHVVSSLGLLSGGVLMSGGWDKTVRTWDGEKCVATLEGHEIAVNAVLGLPDGSVASGSGDQTICIWRDGQKLRSIAVGSPVRALASCGGTRLASASNDGTVRLWDVSTGSQLAAKKVTDAVLYSVAYGATIGGAAELAVGADDGTLAIFELDLDAQGQAALRPRQTLHLLGEVYGLAFLQSGDLAAACGDESCVLWTRSPGRAAAPGMRKDYDEKVAALLAARGAPAAAATAGGSTTAWDFSFPVEFGSRKMNIQWNRGEDPTAVATRFIQQNGLDATHARDVVAFVQQTEQRQPGAGGGGGVAAGGAAGGQYDFSYPVEIADGRKLTISWNRGEDPQQVATRFASQHGGMQPGDLNEIVAFVQQVSGGPAAPMTFQQAPAQVSPQMQQESLAMVMSMGFDESTAKAALEASAWSVEQAVNRLLG